MGKQDSQTLRKPVRAQRALSRPQPVVVAIGCAVLMWCFVACSIEDSCEVSAANQSLEVGAKRRLEGRLEALKRQAPSGREGPPSSLI